jgi:hypothetical protein
VSHPLSLSRVASDAVYFLLLAGAVVVVGTAAFCFVQVIEMNSFVNRHPFLCMASAGIMILMIGVAMSRVRRKIKGGRFVEGAREQRLISDSTAPVGWLS